MVPTSPKAQAKEAALEYVNGRMMGKKVFVHIKNGTFIKDLQENIRHPSRIHQGDTSFCGPASVLHALAKYHPMEYAKFALDLYQKGQAAVRGGTVDAGYLKDQPIPESMKVTNTCDWVTMSSLRYNLSALSLLSALTTVTTKVQGTYPFEIKIAFEKMGYTDVRNETGFSRIGIDNFRMANELLKKGFRVVLSVNDDMFNDPDGTSWLPRGPNHFCTLKGVEKIEDRIKCRMWQWGIRGGKKEEPAKLPVGAHVDLTKEKFAEFYFGYVAAGEYQPIAT